MWVYPHGSPGEAVTATVDLISENQRSIALRLREKPSWVRIADGILLHKDYGQIEIRMMREAIGGRMTAKLEGIRRDSHNLWELWQCAAGCKPMKEDLNRA